MKQETRFTPLEQQQTAASTTQQQPGVTFASAEEVLRRDAVDVTVPPRVAERLEESIAKEPPPARPWWKRMLPG